jgi:type III restriction enzyme
MSGFQVPEPILCSPFEEPGEHWNVAFGETPERIPGRRRSMYFWRDPKAPPDKYRGHDAGIAIELMLVNLIRERVRAWRQDGYPGVTRTTSELLHWWRRDGRATRLFFAQVEATETIVFLVEARADYLQGISVPRDDPSEAERAAGFAGFTRYACKMATGTGKTLVMGMLAAWSILNKRSDRGAARFSDVVLVVCPNVTIRQRLGELDPRRGDASIYVTRDLVPRHLIPHLARGRVLVTNWHVFEPKTASAGGVSARVVKSGRPVVVRETIHIGEKTTTARGARYLTVEDFERQLAAGLFTVVGEKTDRDGRLRQVAVESWKYVESDKAVVERVLGREVGGKRNLLVLNDEAHHAYRIRTEVEEEGADVDDEDDLEEEVREATVWVSGLDRIQKLRGINLCVDLSATPYYLSRVGHEANRPFPWVVSDFGLTDSIESGLVKIPELAVRDTTGAEIPGYFNVWSWILPQLTPAERGGRKASPKPEAILKYAHHPLAMLASLWEEEQRAWAKNKHDPRPPVFIVVCRNTRIAKVLYEWLAEAKSPAGIPRSTFEGFRNRDGAVATIRVDSKVVYETDTGEAKDAEMRWMRFTLDTVGKTQWPTDARGNPAYPEGFEELAEELDRPVSPPGRDVRCIVSVGMLTEGWDCNTVTHIIGLRPFMSQLLCEQVVGRGLRRVSYEVRDDGRLTEEVARIFGVPFEVVPYKASPKGPSIKPPKRYHIHALPERAHLVITFPRVEGYTQAIRNRIEIDWDRVAGLDLMPGRIPPEVQMKGSLLMNQGRGSLAGPGRLENVGLEAFRAAHRLQELVFELAAALAHEYVGQAACTVPPHVLFPQLADVVRAYIERKVRVHQPADIKDLFLSPYYGWLVERLVEAIRPATRGCTTPEVPRFEANRKPGSSSDVDFWTSRDVREVLKSHVNLAVADTTVWEQCATYLIDRHPAVRAFVKNAGLGFAIPYLHNGRMHDYEPDFLIVLSARPEHTVILETKGYDPLEEVKRAAAERWVDAVNADRRYGTWSYALAKKPTDVGGLLSRAAAGAA